ncbi:ABC-type multidrug transport system, ATPase and permease component [Terriglobus roseus DSM 18391]|uniref:ABC-type multidrug transport system, ATPase and permease component n=1 Tax=Terriglobus roseus (strain DSM 18391 / NRRL B-41598 / KBS 63) TaxID=926566 RepID=I3ZEL1_TERRK|nr:ABC transporter ATP-binding protein [Terriglobus roseus]AFL87679.1 ABC-type multidrug transport system, ATPase and permease component [Terriglobus roseus DSM 18391]
MGSFGPSMSGGHSTRSMERTARNPSRSISAELTQKKPKPPLKKVWPEVKKLVKPRLPLLGVSLLVLIINRACGLVLPASTKYLIDDVMRQHHAALLPRIVGMVVTATILQGLTTFALTQMLSKAGQRLITEMRTQVQSHIGRLPVAYYDANRSGTLVARIMSDVEGVRNIIGTGLVDFLGGLMTAIFAFIYLIRLSTQMTLLTFGVLVLFGGVMARAFKTIRPIFRARAIINAEVTGRLTESLGGVRVVKGYHAEASEAKVFADGAQRLLKNVISTLTAQSIMALSSTAVMGIVGALVMYLGARQVLAGTLTTGGYVTYTMFLAFMIAPLMSLVNIGTQITEALAGLDRTAEILNEREEDAYPKRTVVLPPIAGDVVFDNVMFEYDPGKPVLHGVSFEARPDTVTALVGSSGSGKSTIISLVCAFHDATTGKVLVDGIDLSTVQLASYRSQLGVVLQETFLFDGTIRDNVVFSRPDATEEQLMEACRIARVDEFVERFELGYDTIVGERGVKLSGGQRQRLSIARAILADPRILILDEATSSLDSESEAMIQQGLNHLMTGRTTFVIAHRLSTIRNADQILVIEGGNIVERGTHTTLFALRGRYRELYDRQHGLESNLFLAPGEGDKLVEPAAV